MNAFGAERRGQLEARLVARLPVHHDRADARGLQHLQVQEPERPRADDRRRCAGRRLHSLQRVHRGRERLEERRALERDLVGQRQQRRGRHDDELGEHAGAREPDVMPVLTEVVAAAQAVMAVAAAGDGLDADARARRRPAGARPELDDLARRFMPDDQRRQAPDVAAAIDTVVEQQIGAAQPDGPTRTSASPGPGTGDAVSSTSRWPTPGAVL